MIETESARGKVVAATMKLAADTAWRQLTLREIAHAAGLSLADLKAEFSSKGAILAAFVEYVDDEVIRRSEQSLSSEDVERDRLFDVAMTRFEVLMSHKAALRRIAEEPWGRPACDPAMIRALCGSHRWMLAAAGVPTDGITGAAKTAGFATIYADAFRTWLKEDDPGMTKTMARLDRRLRRGQRWVGYAEDLSGGLTDIVKTVRTRLREAREKKAERRQADTNMSEASSNGPDGNAGDAPAPGTA